MRLLDHLRARAVTAALRADRPQPCDDLVAAVTARIDAHRRRTDARLRTATAGALTATLAAALLSVGGVSYAATALQGAAKVVRKAVAPAAPRQAAVELSLSAGGDQYRPGYGFGDPNHNHQGPPGLRRSGAGAAAPPLRAQPSRDRLAALVSTSFTVDEQASLFVSVHDGDDRPLLLTQRSRRGGSRVGQGVGGPQTKFIRYTVLVPRELPLQLRIPRNLLQPGARYTIRLVAFDHTGQRSEIRIPFTL